jgi:hypothetical protein
MIAVRRSGSRGLEQTRGGLRIMVWSPNYAREAIGLSPLAAEWLVARGHSIKPRVRSHLSRRGRVE